MQVKAIYENGAINFAQPLRFKRSKFEVVVNIPEEELESGEIKAPALRAADNTTDASLEAQSSLGTLRAQIPNDPWLQRMKAIEFACYLCRTTKSRFAAKLLDRSVCSQIEIAWRNTQPA